MEPNFKIERYCNECHRIKPIGSFSHPTKRFAQASACNSHFNSPAKEVIKNEQTKTL